MTMNLSTMKGTANILIVGAVIGFLGGAWMVQTTRPAKGALASEGDDLTSSMILSRLARMNQETAELRQQVEAGRKVHPAIASSTTVAKR